MKRLPRASLLPAVLVLMTGACSALNPQPLPPQAFPPLDVPGPPTPNQDSGALAIADGGGPRSLPSVGEAGASEGPPALDAAGGTDAGAPRAPGDAASDAGPTEDAPPAASSSDALSSDAPRGDAKTST